MTISPILKKKVILQNHFSDMNPPRDVDKLSIFANDELNLDEIDVYGYDYDYTLAAYKKTTVEQMIYNLAKKALVQEFQYPEELLQCQYDPQLTIRGLHYDVHKGLLIKVNSMLQIQSDVVFKGKRKLTEWEVSRVYPSRKLTLDKIEVHIYFIVLFSRVLQSAAG